ncbi:MAG: hypothetical protein NVS3B21_03100 [Acidimicrobiales bacterium]
MHHDSRTALALVSAGAVLALSATRSTQGLGAVAAFALLVPFAMVLVRRPQVGILTLIALAPFNGALAIVPHPSAVNAWKELLVLATLGATFICPVEARSQEAQSRPGWVPALALWVVATFAAAGASASLATALGLKVTFFYAFAAWALWRCPLDERERDRVITVLMVTGAIEALFGLVQQAVGPTSLHRLGFPYNSTIRFAGSFFRSFGTFAQPFGLGFYLMAVMLICIPAALSDPGRLRNLLFFAALPMFLAGIAATVVRGAVFGLGVGLAYLGFSRYRILLLAFPLGLIGLVALPPEVSNAALSSTSTGQRATGWRENINVIVSHPLGKGPGTSSAAAEGVAKYRPTESRKTTYQPDNYFYHVAYEAGVIGLWAFLVLLVAAIVTARHRSRAGPAPFAPFAEGTAALLLAGAAASLVASFYEIFPMDALFWVLLAAVSRQPPVLQVADQVSINSYGAP